MLLVSRRVSQPRGVPIIDRSNPLGRSITHCLPLNGHNRELISGAAVTVASTNGIDQRGYSLRGTGSAAAASVSLTIDIARFFSMSFDMYWDAFANDDDLAMEFSPNSNSNPGFIVDPNSGAPTSGTFAFGMRGPSGSAGSSTIARPSAAVWHHYTANYDLTLTNGGVTEVYVDGVAQSVSAGVAVTPNAWSATNTLFIFSRNNASLFGAGRIQNLVFRQNYRLSPAEARAEFENPWQIYMPSSRARWAPDAVAGAVRTRYYYDMIGQSHAA